MSDDDKYTYPGSGGVLINSKGTRDQDRFDQAMNDYASAAMAELSNEPSPDRPAADYLRRIHERLLQRLPPHIARRPRALHVPAPGTGLPHRRPEHTDENMAGPARSRLIFGAKTYDLRQWQLRDPQCYETLVTLYNIDLNQKPDPRLFKISALDQSKN